ncbi:MAG: ribose-5-phosphate isomerase RpiA, partial [Halobacteriaceae archaeon]
ITGIPTSYDSRQIARDAGISVAELADVEKVDVAIDGADQVTSRDAIKGGGAAHTREKVVDAFADRLYLVVDETKVVTNLSHPIPVEVLPFARTTVCEALKGLGGNPEIRRAKRKDGPLVTDNGNFILDCDFGRITEPKDLAAKLGDQPGIVDHGLFIEMADKIVVGDSDDVFIHER